ncbi:MAG: hypothetical protein P8X96_07935 [Desulfobacteraceae bacterium]
MKSIKVNGHTGLINLPILLSFGDLHKKAIDFILPKRCGYGLIAMQVTLFNPVQEKGDLFVRHNPLVG